MPTHRTYSSIDPSSWHMLREYLVDAYSNPEMRVLVELTLLAEAGNRLPDERVPTQEYATTLCALIQRHSGVPSREFWRQLTWDRPLREPEIERIKRAFGGAVNDVASERRAPAGPIGRVLTPLRIVVVTLTAMTAATATYCATAPTDKKETIMCRDGTRSPSCYEIDSGCCAGHGGVLRPGEQIK